MRLLPFPILAIFLITSGCCNSKKSSESAAQPSSGVTASPSNSPLIGTQWKLTELMGKPISEYKFQKHPFILIGDDMRMVGNGGCNSMFGPVEIMDGNRITFGNIGVTLMACMEENTEALMLEVLKKADNYSIQGNQLSLNKARMAPLARFEAEEK